MSNKKTYLIFIIVLLTSSLSVFAQNNPIESDFQKLNIEEKLKYYTKLPDTLKKSNAKYFNKTFKNLLTKELKSDYLKGIILELIGLNKNLDDFTISIQILELLEDKSIRLSLNDRIEILKELSRGYYALNLLSEVFEINSRLDQLVAEGGVLPLWDYNYKSRLYYQLREYNLAASALKKEIKHLKIRKDRDSLIIPSAYNDLGLYYFLQKKYDSSYYHYKKALIISEKSLLNVDSTNYRAITTVTKKNIAAVFIKSKRYEEAIPLILADIKLRKQSVLKTVNDVSILLDSYNLLLECYDKLNLDAEMWQTLQDIDKIYYREKDRNGFIKYLNYKMKYFKSVRSLDSSLIYSQKAFRLKHEMDMNTLNVLLKINGLRYELAKKAQFIKKQKSAVKDKELTLKRKQQQKILVLVIILLVLLVITLCSMYKLKLNKKAIEAKNLKINTALSEKKVLLQEIHHRVKNNLQIISGLLELQNITVNDPNLEIKLKESQNRIKSVALVHKMMYQSEDISSVYMQDSLSELVKTLSETYSNYTQKVSTVINAENIHLDIRSAVTVNLIVNEAICNSFKHAFKANDNNKIELLLKRNEVNKEFQLIIKDNGIGLPNDFNIENLTSIGFDLINGLVNQLNGVLKISNNNGTEILITFLINENEK